MLKCIFHTFSSFLQLQRWVYTQLFVSPALSDTAQLPRLIPFCLLAALKWNNRYEETWKWKHLRQESVQLLCVRENNIKPYHTFPPVGRRSRYVNFPLDPLHVTEIFSFNTQGKILQIDTLSEYMCDGSSTHTHDATVSSLISYHND